MLAIADMERAGIDIVTDGEIRRESYSNHFATALEGIDIDNPAKVPGRAGGTNAVPRVVGKSGARARSRSTTAIPARPHRPHDQGHRARPVHHGQQARTSTTPTRPWRWPRGRRQRGGPRPGGGGHRRRPARRAVAAVAGREGARVRGPRDRPGARRPAVTTALHTCFGYATSSKTGRRLPLPGRARRLRRRPALHRGRPAEARPRLLEPSPARRWSSACSTSTTTPVSRRRMRSRAGSGRAHRDPGGAPQVGPDCGMKYLPRDVAFGKLRALVEGARLATG